MKIQTLLQEGTEFVIAVLAKSRELSLVYRILEEFAPNREALNSDYACRADGSDFDNEKEMLQYFVEREHVSQNFMYWSSEPREKSRVDVGACFTSDGDMVIILSSIANGEKEFLLFDQLKASLNSTCGTVMFGGFPEFEDGGEFRKRYCS